ncbi:MAG: restriction endonuclease subunit S [Candidatus Ozemobacteraceae bacterium]
MIKERIAGNELDPRRLDSEYYWHGYRRITSLIQGFESHGTFESLQVPSIPIRRGIDMPVIVDYPEAPYLIPIGSFEEPGLSEIGLEKIDPKQHEKFKGSKVSPGDLLVAMGGYVGKAAIVPKDFPNSNIGRHTARIVIDEAKVDKYFLWTFITSKVGNIYFERLVTGSVQAGINLEDLKEIIIPLVHSKAQRYIGDKVRQAECLRALGKRNRDFAFSSVRSLFSNAIGRTFELTANFSAKHSRIKSGQIVDRLDGWFYKKEFLDISELLATLQTSGIGLKPIKEIGEVGYGFMPLEDYFSENTGASFLRVTNIPNQLEFDLADVKYVNPQESNHPDYRLKYGDIFIVQLGNSTGRIGFIGKDLEGWVFPPFALRITNVSTEWDSGFIAAFLASPLGQIQIQRSISITSVRPNTTKPAIENILIPTFPYEKQCKIGSAVRCSETARFFSSHLISFSKLLVEDLIEGMVSENELVVIQEALDCGDTEPEKALFKRLSTKRLDVPGEPPLFPNPDDLYNLLRDAEPKDGIE